MHCILLTYLFYNWKCVPFDRLYPSCPPRFLASAEHTVTSPYLCSWAFCFVLSLNSTCNEIVWCVVFVFLSLTDFTWQNVLRVQDGLLISFTDISYSLMCTDLQIHASSSHSIVSLSFGNFLLQKENLKQSGCKMWVYQP